MICVSVQEKSFGDCRAILESCEMAELRADLCRLSVEEVERLVEQFGVSAAIAKKCGYDGVEVHAVHEG